MKKLNRAGFTMPEVIMTMVMAVFVATALIWSSMNARYTVRMGTNYSQAMMTARTYLEQAKAAGYSAVANATVNNVVINDNATASSTDDVQGTVTTAVTDNGNSTKTVTVTVSWVYKAFGKKTNRQVSLSTLLSNY